MEIGEFKCEVCPRKINWKLYEEELPETSDYYLATYRFRDGGCMVHEIYYNYEEEGWFVNEDLEKFGFEPDIIAWAELPKPYRVQKNV